MKLLLLAGTAEARALATRLAGDARVAVLASLAGATQRPEPYPVAVRRGGFGGELGFEKFIQDNGIEIIIDATHAFAAVMPRRAHRIAARRRLGHLRLLRPGWTEAPGDRWTRVADPVEAAAAVAPGARVFLATGGRSLARYAALADGRHVVVRVIDPPGVAFPFAQGEWRVERPPVSVEAEIRWFRDAGIEAVVAKDAGGPADAKLAAARALGLPVVLLDRPAPPPGDRVDTVAAALAWLERRL